MNLSLIKIKQRMRNFSIKRKAILAIACISVALASAACNVVVVGGGGWKGDIRFPVNPLIRDNNYKELRHEYKTGLGFLGSYGKGTEAEKSKMFFSGGTKWFNFRNATLKDGYSSYNKIFWNYHDYGVNAQGYRETLLFAKCVLKFNNATINNYSWIQSTHGGNRDCRIILKTKKLSTGVYKHIIRLTIYVKGFPNPPGVSDLKQLDMTFERVTSSASAIQYLTL